MRNSTQPSPSVRGYNACLTQREREIAALVATGASNKEIAHRLTISDKTVMNMLTKVFVKTGTRSRTELAVRLVRFQVHLAAISN